LGRFVFVNRQLRQLYESISWEGKTVFDILPADLAQLVFDDDQEVLRTGEPSERNYDSTEPDGQSRRWVVYRFPMRDMYGRRLMGGVCVLTSRNKFVPKPLCERLKRSFAPSVSRPLTPSLRQISTRM
jgi:PAS domain-containing protein